MDVNGIVVAASEIIRLEKGCGIVLTIHNKHLNLTFYILTKDEIAFWKRIFVNCFYKFSCLKIGAIEWLSGVKKVILLTTPESEFQEILEHQLEKFGISDSLIKKLSVPSIVLQSEVQSFSRLISYQGVITKVKSSKFGIYELDNKINLYCIFNSFRAVLSVLKEGCEVFVSNAHFLTDIKARKLLVCCGLSSVRTIVPEVNDSLVNIPNVENEDNSFSSSLIHYPLSAYDVIWLEMVFENLNAKFYSTVIEDNFHFHWENEILWNILECFSYPLNEVSYSKRHSIGDEYCSNPHLCSLFSDDILPTGCKVSCISDIVNEAFQRLFWTENSEYWKTCLVQNETNDILIGMLYLSKNGSWYIMDETCNIPIVFSQSCNQCKFLKNLLCSHQNLNYGYLVALQKFEIIYERIKYNTHSNISYRYLRTSCCYAFHLGTFLKQNHGLFCFISIQEPHLLQLNNNNSFDELSEVFKSISIDSQQSQTRIKSFYEDNGDFLNNNVRQRILLLNKLWTIVDKTFVCRQVVVLLLPQGDVHEDYLDKSKSIFADSYNFYETEDDYDFAELVDKMDCLFLEEKPKLALLHFESARQCASMLPGHIYVLDFTNSSKDNPLYRISDNSKLKPILIKIKSGVKILHHAECLGNHCPDDYQIDAYSSIKQIISERKIRENVLIEAVIKDKLYEECTSSSSSQSELDVGKTFCLILKDCEFDDTIKVYLPFCPKNMFGYLPGTQLQMFGFVCICSRKGYLYLKPSSSFGIHVISSDTCSSDNSTFLASEYLQCELKIGSLKRMTAGTFFKSLCFVVKIISVKLYQICNSCGKDFSQKCSCLCSYNVRLTLSFIIDDGTAQILTYCNNETARKVLMLKEKEWCGLTSYVTETRSCLEFHPRSIESNNDSSASHMQKVFSAYCSSKFLCRQIYIKCRKKSNGFKIDEASLWCDEVLPINETHIMQDFLVKLKYTCS